MTPQGRIEAVHDQRLLSAVVVDAATKRSAVNGDPAFEVWLGLGRARRVSNNATGPRAPRSRIRSCRRSPSDRNRVPGSAAAAAGVGSCGCECPEQSGVLVRVLGDKPRSELCEIEVPECLGEPPVSDVVDASAAGSFLPHGQLVEHCGGRQ